MMQQYPSYPRHIIGKPNYKIIDKIGFLSQKGFYIGRTTAIQKEQFLFDNIKESFKSGVEIKYSTLKNGISVNLLAVYKKKDMKFFAIEDKEKPCFHVPMKLGFLGKRPIAGEYLFDASKNYYGFKIATLKALEIELTYKAKGIMPANKIHFDIEHSPTMSNFWHFNIVLWGQDSISGEWIKLRCPEIISNATFEKIAYAIFPILAEKIILPKKMRAKKINKKYYSK